MILEEHVGLKSLLNEHRDGRQLEVGRQSALLADVESGGVSYPPVIGRLTKTPGDE